MITMQTAHVARIFKKMKLRVAPKAMNSFLWYHYWFCLPLVWFRSVWYACVCVCVGYPLEPSGALYRSISYQTLGIVDAECWHLVPELWLDGTTPNRLH